MTLAFANRLYLEPTGTGCFVRLHTGHSIVSGNVNDVVVIAILNIQYLLIVSGIINRAVLKIKD